MCGIAAILKHSPTETSEQDTAHLRMMKNLLAHRGPDDSAFWTSADKRAAFVHTRLGIISPEDNLQPMSFGDFTIAFNGEVYNYVELRKQLRSTWQFRTNSDTEVIMASYAKWGTDCVRKFRGMFAFVLWDNREKTFFAARDPFGIKPLYWTQIAGGVALASEIKALLPIMEEVAINPEALKDYLYFQLYLEGKTLFKGVHEIPPAHAMLVRNGDIQVRRYWEVYYHPEYGRSSDDCADQLSALMDESIALHLRSDVPVNAYVSGGLDSSIVAALGSRASRSTMLGFHGRFGEGAAFDESRYARALANYSGLELHDVEITAKDFVEDISKVIWHLDQPVAGPGSFPQFCVSRLAAAHGKVVLGGQGGDEIFGGYVRYLIAYFEQCIRGAINGTLHNGNYVVTYESIIPNLKLLNGYEPMLQEFWRDGLFEAMDQRYFRLLNRSRDLSTEINWKDLGDYHPFEAFAELFNGSNVGHEAYFDKMTHFDFKTLLPALLHVEDRMSMAHGLESRVPFLDLPLVEFAATIPADVKFKDGKLKRLPLHAFKDRLPPEVVDREDKMGFPVPLQKWFQGELKTFVRDVFSSQRAREREYFNSGAILDCIDKEPKYGRKLWGLLSVELWFQQFIDTKAYNIKQQ